MNNPYSAPNAELADPASESEFYHPKIFSVQGRIGRLRYLAYTFFLMVILTAAIGILSAVLIPTLAAKDRSGLTMIVLIGLLYSPIIAVTLIMAKRRFNDLDRSGWLAVLMLVPFLNFFCGLYLVFGPGSSEANRYGAPPVRNSALVVIAGLALPILFTVGTFAAIAIPAFQAFKERAVQSAVPAPFSIASNSSGLSLWHRRGLTS